MWRRTRLVNDTHGSAIAKIHSAFIFTWTFWVTPQRIGTIGAWLPGGVWVGWGVPEVLAAFVTTPAIMCGNHDDLKTTDDLFDKCSSPRTESLVAAAVHSAERIMRKIDNVFSG
jgi:hypothetical protein